MKYLYPLVVLGMLAKAFIAFLFIIRKGQLPPTYTEDNYFGDVIQQEEPYVKVMVCQTGEMEEYVDLYIAL